MSNDIEIKGLKEIQKRLRKIAPNLADKALQSATTAAAKVFVEPAKSNAPKHTGEMAETIKARKFKTNSRYQTAASVRPRKGGGHDPYYWLFVELGTVKQPPQPFLRSAFDGNAKEAGDKFKKILQNGLKRAVKRYAI